MNIWMNYPVKLILLNQMSQKEIKIDVDSLMNLLNQNIIFKIKGTSLYYFLILK